MAETQYPRGIEVAVGPYIINEKQQVLLVKSPKWEHWIICGGHVEADETIEQALFRETEEELGIQIEIIDFLRLKEEFVAPPLFKRPAHFLFLDYIVKAQNLNFNPNEEISEYRWFTIEEALADPDLKPSIREGLLVLKNWLTDPDNLSKIKKGGL